MKLKKVWNIITLLVLLIGFSMIAHQWFQLTYSMGAYSQITNGIYVIYFVFGLTFIGMFIGEDYSLVKKES